MASVMGIVAAITFDGYTARLSADFDPATDEVIVVKKDAARIWVEQGEHAKALHSHQPSWTGYEWDDSGYVECTNILPGICDGDCVEFVAVKTHRPPVEHEAKLPEPVVELVSATDSILPPGCSTEIVSAPVPSAGQGVATC